MSNTRNTPVEAIEHYLPVRICRYGLRRGSGGAGRFPGGDGLVREYEAFTETEITVLSERRTERPWGVLGGSPGASGVNVVIRRDGRVEPLGAKARVRLAAGDRLRIETPGGGGYGTAEEGPSSQGVAATRRQEP
jgi:N-methylhydantoinase B/oxoprolinase/acetone carboxylase alpha subunit